MECIAGPNNAKEGLFASKCFTLVKLYSTYFDQLNPFGACRHARTGATTVAKSGMNLLYHDISPSKERKVDASEGAGALSIAVLVTHQDKGPLLALYVLKTAGWFGRKRHLSILSCKPLASRHC